MHLLFRCTDITHRGMTIKRVPLDQPDPYNNPDRDVVIAVYDASPTADDTTIIHTHATADEIQSLGMLYDCHEQWAHEHTTTATFEVDI